jgi:hypothetical protein
MPGWQLGALLYELRANRLHDRSDQIAGASSDYLWSDQTLVNYLNEAQRKFARESLCIRDGSTAAVTQITTVNGQNLYPLDPSVIAVLSIRMQGNVANAIPADNADLVRAGHADFNAFNPPDMLFWNAALLDNLPPGKPVAWSTDEDLLPDRNGSFGAMNLLLYPTIASPYDGIVGQMRVIREPINDLVVSNLEAYLEIPAAHHLDILDWAAYLALSNVDTDIAGGDAAGRADKFATRFDAAVLRAKKDALRKMFTPQQWGFGRNGWSWET